jgi:RNA polymerase sigma factor (sigma-70 family)
VTHQGRQISRLMTNKDSLSLESALTRLRLSAGDAEAWEVVFRETWPYVLGFGRAFLGRRSDMADAEDIAQDVFFLLARALHRGRVDLPQTVQGIRTLLQVITRNRAMDFVRQRHRKQRDARRQVAWSEAEFVVSRNTAAHECVEGQEALEKFFRRLDPFDSQVAQMLLQGLKPREIARRLNSSTKTIYRRERWLRSLLDES